jgi:hypothetical protein
LVSSSLAVALFAACSESSVTTPVDAAIADVSAEVAVDAGNDTASADTKVPVDARPACDACLYDVCPTWTSCESATLLEPGATLTMLDTATGGRGDCAAHASGLGGPALYYLLDVPADKWARVVMKSLDADASPLLRVLSDCYALKTETGALGGKVTDGRATLCLRDFDSPGHRVVIAASRYSGEFDNSAIKFDLSVEYSSPGDGCSP